MDLTFKLSVPSEQDIIINYRVGADSDTAERGSDYESEIQRAILMPSGSTRINASIDLIDNELIENKESFEIEIISIEGDAIISSEESIAMVSISDNEALPELSVANTQSTEDSEFVFIIERTGDTNIISQVDYSIGSPEQEGDARESIDFTALTGTAIFNVGETQVQVRVPIIDDADSESIETIYINLDNASGAVLSSSRATGIILDNDNSQAQFSVLSNSVSESDDSVIVTVVRSGDLTDAVTVDYSLQAISATVGSDYTDTSGTLSFEAGQTEATFTVNITDDEDKFEGDDVIGVVLSNASQGEIVADDLYPLVAGTITITDDDVQSISRVEIGDSDEAGFTLNTNARIVSYAPHEFTKVGDLNGDGLNEIITEYEYVLFSQGDRTVYTQQTEVNGINGFRGSSSGGDITAYQDDTGNRDANGDGLDDLVIGNYIVFGRDDWSMFVDSAGRITDESWLQIIDPLNGFSQYIAQQPAIERVLFFEGEEYTERYQFEINHDGYTDYVFKIRASDAVADDRTEKWIFVYGDGEPTSYYEADKLDLTGRDGFVIEPTLAKHVLEGVNAIGDVNGDGLQDFVLKAGARHVRNQPDSEAILLLGSDDLISPDENEDALNLQSLVRLGSNDNKLGVNFSGVGDTNGDGIDDFIITNGNDTSNTTYLIYGGEHLANGAEINVDSDLSCNIGVRLDSRFPISSDPSWPDGYRITALDFNGDGLSDLLFYNAFDGVPSFLLYGVQGGLDVPSIVLEDYVASGEYGFRIEPHTSSGKRVEPLAMDFDGDGYDDLIMTTGRDGEKIAAILYGSNMNSQITQAGTQDNDVIIGTELRDVINSGAGNDYIETKGGHDQVVAGIGDDTIVIPDLDFTIINGGDGYDTVVFDFAGVDIDVSDISSRLSEIEELHLSDENAGTITVSLSDVLNINNSLSISGDADDQLILESRENGTVWHATGNTKEHLLTGEIYSQYAIGDIFVYVQSDLPVMLV